MLLMFSRLTADCGCFQEKKSKKHKRKHKKKRKRGSSSSSSDEEEQRGSGGPVRLSEFVKDADAVDVRYSSMTGKKIMLHREETAGDARAVRQSPPFFFPTSSSLTPQLPSPPPAFRLVGSQQSRLTHALDHPLAGREAGPQAGKIERRRPGRDAGA